MLGQDTIYIKNIEEREDGGTPPIVQKIRCALAFWVKDFIGTSLIEHRESFFIKKAIKRLSGNPNIKILGSITAKRAPVLSFLVYSTDKESSTFSLSGGTTRGKPLHGRFVVKLFNDLFGIQARGGCACAGPYGHMLLGVGQKQSLKLRSAIKKVQSIELFKIQYNCPKLLVCVDHWVINNSWVMFSEFFIQCLFESKSLCL